MHLGPALYFWIWFSILMFDSCHFCDSMDKDSYDFGNIKSFFHSLLSIIIHRSESASSNASVMPEAEGEIPLSSFKNAMVKMGHTILIKLIECVGKDKLVMGRALPDLFHSAAMTFASTD